MRLRLHKLLGGVALLAIFALLVRRIMSMPLRSQDKKIGSKPDHHAVPGSLSAKVLQMAQAEAERAEMLAVRGGDEKQVLTRAFARCDKDASSTLTLPEAVSCISKQVTLHLTQAIRENFFIFTAVDLSPRNGAVSWTEHVTYYLKRRGYDQHFISEHLHSLKGLRREEKESIMRDRAAWSEAARTDPDVLSLDEFLSFRHPESSHATIMASVEEMLGSLDKDDNGALDQAEYTQSSGATVSEFQDIDSNGDGKLDRKELLLYRDPRHPHHSRVEASLLFAAADGDTDGFLTLAELLQQPQLFAASKLVDAARSFHNEF